MISELAIDCSSENDRIVSFIADFVSRRGADGVVLGLSGGIDSALAAALCAKALSPAKVHALILPERDSSPESKRDAKRFAEKLGIHYSVEDITDALDALGCYRGAMSTLMGFRGLSRGVVRLIPGLRQKGFLAHVQGAESRQLREFVAFFRMKHRVRLVSFCREAEAKNLLIASCANRSEYETGFFVRYGDDSGDFAPIKHLYKMQVFQLSAWLGLPEEILDKKPSPDLFAGLGDEEIMGISYELLDSILVLVKGGASDAEIARRANADPKTIGFVKNIMAQSQKMRDAPASLL